MRIFITGRNGFIGNHLSSTLEDAGHEVISNTIHLSTQTEPQMFHENMRGCDVVIHCAAAVHQPYAEYSYEEINVDGTKQLALAAIQCDVKKFIFLSSTAAICPETPYGRSKLRAEAVLETLSAQDTFNPIILRLPTVYGYGAKGAPAKLFNLCKKGYPLPLDKIKNQKSFLSIYNLNELILFLVKTQVNSSEPFSVSDPRSMSTTEFTRLLINGMGSNSLIFQPPLFSILLKLLSPNAYRQIYSSLAVSNKRLHDIFGWSPNLSTAESIQKWVAEETLKCKSDQYSSLHSS